MTSACEMVTKLGESVRELDPLATLKAGVDSPIYRNALVSKLHSDCPVPLDIIKAVQVEVGLALPCDAIIHFEIPEGKEVPVIRKGTGQ